jgi:hypothetical protein
VAVERETGEKEGKGRDRKRGRDGRKTERGTEKG